jgi:thiaminase
MLKTVIALLILLAPVATMAGPAERSIDMLNLYGEQLQLIMADGDADTVNSYIDKVRIMYSDILKECEETRNKQTKSEYVPTSESQKILLRSEVNKCDMAERNGAEAIAQTMLASANYYVQGKKKDKAKAKGLYREVITTFTTPRYTKFVKEAEFGLEDLKAMADEPKKEAKKSKKKVKKSEN